MSIHFGNKYKKLSLRTTRFALMSLSNIDLKQQVVAPTGRGNDLLLRDGAMTEGAAQGSPGVKPNSNKPTRLEGVEASVSPRRP